MRIGIFVDACIAARTVEEQCSANKCFDHVALSESGVREH